MAIKGNDRGLKIDDSSFVDDVFMMDDRHEEERHHKTPDSMKFPCGLMCSLWCADFPHRPVVLFGFIEEQTRENLGGLLFFDVMMMVTYRSCFKAHPWPLPFLFR